MICGLTILRPISGAKLAKEYTVAANGQVVKRDYPEVATFKAQCVAVDSLAALHRVLVVIERDPTACVIRGKPRDDANLARTPRLKRRPNGTGVFEDAPRHWIMVDADKVKLPAGTSVIDDPEDVARHLVDLFSGFAPDLAGASCIVQFSSSAGIEEMAEAEAAAGLPPRWDGVCKRGSNSIGAHLWYWLETPHDHDELDRWAKAINAAVGHKAVDPATMRTVQPLYTAGPVFGRGLRDPLPGRRTVFIADHPGEARKGAGDRRQQRQHGRRLRRPLGAHRATGVRFPRADQRRHRLLCLRQLARAGHRRADCGASGPHRCCRPWRAQPIRNRPLRQ
jgi:hypothetical protein